MKVATIAPIKRIFLIGEENLFHGDNIVSPNPLYYNEDLNQKIELLIFKGGLSRILIGPNFEIETIVYYAMWLILGREYISRKKFDEMNWVVSSVDLLEGTPKAFNSSESLGYGNFERTDLVIFNNLQTFANKGHREKTEVEFLLKKTKSCRMLFFECEEEA